MTAAPQLQTIHQLNSEFVHFLPDSFFRTNVELLAHYLYVCRGCKEGRALNHWLEAEQQLRNNLFVPIERAADVG